MAHIIPLERHKHPALPGVTITPLGGHLMAGEEQDVLVEVASGAHIPLHTHRCRAEMYVVSGRARVRSHDAEIDGVEVGPGTLVVFEAGVPHGFENIGQFFGFVSRNGGIVDRDPQRWDITF